jgi:ribose transport system substrate-binding protein
MNRPLLGAKVLALMSAGVLALAACSSSSNNTPASQGSGPADASAPSWCGPKKIVLGLADGFGGNSWRQVTAASARDEAAKCPSVTSFEYADGQGDTQKSISDVQGMAAKGVDSLVVFPDAGQVMLPVLRRAYKAGVVTVPYRVTPGGQAGKDYNVFVDTDFSQAGRLWGQWIQQTLPSGGNVLFLSGPPGNSQGLDEARGLHEVLDPTGRYTFIGEQPFEVTHWDPAETQKVLSAAIAQNPKIDVIVSDFGPTLVSALPLFEQSGRSIPAIAASDGNVLSCFWEDHKARNPDFKLFTVSTQNDHSRLAIDWAVALATGGKTPDSHTYPSTAFENSVTGQPNPVKCDRSLPDDVYLSAQLPGAVQARVLNK